MNEHEYALISGINRAQVGRYIAIASAAISAFIVFLLLLAIDVANNFGVPANLPPSILSLVGAGAVFATLYWVFEKYAWRWAIVGAFLKVPDLRGDWKCEGKTLNPEGKVIYSWNAQVTIIQSWDKIRVRLRTDQSGSNSISAALIHDEADGYRLLYNYKNDPRIDQPELKPHRGFAELVFAKDMKSAEGEYFNGHGRFTFGTMHLLRT